MFLRLTELTTNRFLPPAAIDNPQFVDGPEYDKLRGDVEKIKALMGPAAVAAVPVPGKEGLQPVPGAAEALGPWANKTIRQAADDVSLGRCGKGRRAVGAWVGVWMLWCWATALRPAGTLLGHACHPAR